MLTHEGANTITNDLRSNNMNSAYGQLSGLVETWLNRAAASGLTTNGLQGLMAHPQVSFFPNSQAGIDREAQQLDPRIGQMLDTYLHSRNAGDPGIMGSVNQYLNRDLTDSLYSQGYRDWYDRSQLLGAFGDIRQGGRTSLQQEFLNNPRWNVPEYNVAVDPQIRLNPTEGDVNALDDFRNSFRLPTPLPPSRPDDGSAGIAPRGQDDGLSGTLDGLRNLYDQVGNGVSGVGQTLSDGARSLLNNIFGGNTISGSAPGPYDFTGANNSGGLGAPTGVFGNGINATFPTGPTSFANGGRLSGGINPTGAFSGFGINPSAYGITGLPQQNGGTLQNFGMGTGQTLGPNVTSYTAQPDATQQTAGFDPSASSTIGPGGAFPTLGFTGATSSTDKGGATIASPYGAPGLSPLLGPGQTVGTQGPGLMGGTAGFNGTTAPTLSPGTTTPTLGFDGTSAGPMVGPDLTPTLQTGTTVGTQGPGTTVQSWEPGSSLSPGLTLPTQTVETQGSGPAVGTVGPGLMGPTFGPNATAATQGPGLMGGTVGFNGTVAPTLGPSSFDDGKGGVPGLSPLIGPGQTVQTLGPGPTVTATEPPALGPGFSANGFGTAGGTTGLSPSAGTGAPTGSFIGPGSAGGFTGFDAAGYLAANPDVAAAHVDPLQHYLNNGFREGRALDTQGHTLSQNFDAAAYLARNPDVATAGMNPLVHFLSNGAREGRGYDIGTSPYTFSGSNVGGGMGAQPMNFNGLNPLAGAAGPSAQVGPYDFSGQNVSGGVSNGAFGLGGMGGNAGFGLGNPYGFSGANVGGGLGAMSQSFGSLYPVGGYAGSPAGGGIGSPYGFSGADVSGFSANTGGQEDFGSGEGLGPVTYESSGGFDPVSSQRAYFAHQENMNNQAIAAGRTPVQNATAITPNPWAVQLANSAPRLQPITPYVQNAGGAMVVNSPTTQLSTSWMPLGTPGFGGFMA